MIKNYIAHKLFLISMFSVCALAVVFFVKQQVHASSENKSTSTDSLQQQASWSEVSPSKTVVTQTQTAESNVQSSDSSSSNNTETKQIKSQPSNQVESYQNQPVVENSGSQQQTEPTSLLTFKEGEKSEIVAEPVVIAAKDLKPENNPKISGAINDSLQVISVSLNKKDEKNSVLIFGKSEPGTIVSLFIFSEDPIVIKVKADAGGNWNYELEKNLADGQHQAFVAVTDDLGKVISKSEPIAFVKTAQAATVIPMSQFTGNESPIEKSSSQYILMAIAIMAVCLVIALILIGFLTHKRNLDEGIN